MDIQATFHNHEIRLRDVNSLAKAFEDIPTFEEAFDTVSLRKFFQEFESTNSQSAFSPRKESSIQEETHSQPAEQRDALLSPMAFTLNRSNSDTFLTDTRINFSFNFNLNAKLLNYKQSIQAQNPPPLKIPPFTILRVPPTVSSQPRPQLAQNGKALTLKRKQSSPKTGKAKSEAKTVTQQSHHTACQQDSQGQLFQQINESELINVLKSAEDRSFESRLRNKKIFVIQRDVKSNGTSLNVKRQASFPLEESLAPIIKQVKPHNQFPAEINMISGVNTFYPLFSNYLKMLDERKAQNFNAYPAGNNQNEADHMKNMFYDVQKY